MATRTASAKDEQLPSTQEALAAYAAALNTRQERMRSSLNRLASDPPQVLILEGGNAEERLSIALWYAARLNCPNETAPCLACPTCLQIGAAVFNDLFILDGHKETIKIAEIRELRRILGEAPRGTGRRVVILAEAQGLGVEAANALLKSLEEPRPGVSFLLLTPQREHLLPTLVSRSWVLTLAWPLTGEDSEPALQSWTEELANFIATGKGWLERTSAKGALDAKLAREIVSAVQKAQASALTHRNGSVLSNTLANLPDRSHIHINDLLSQCQEALDYMVNPSLVLNWLAMQLHMVCRHQKSQVRSAPLYKG